MRKCVFVVEMYECACFVCKVVHTDCVFMYGRNKGFIDVYIYGVRKLVSVCVLYVCNVFGL